MREIICIARMNHYSLYTEKKMKCKTKREFAPCQLFHKSLRNFICITIITKVTKKRIQRGMKPLSTAYQRREFIFRFVLPLKSTLHFSELLPSLCLPWPVVHETAWSKKQSINTALYGRLLQEINDDNFNLFFCFELWCENGTN